MRACSKNDASVYQSDGLSVEGNAMTIAKELVLFMIDLRMGYGVHNGFLVLLPHVPGAGKSRPWKVLNTIRFLSVDLL